MAVPAPSLAQAPAIAVAPAPEAAAPRAVSLEAALGPLSSEEAADVRSWTPKEKLLFFMAYQWTAAVSAPEMKRADGTPYVGILPQFSDAAYQALQSEEPYFTKAPADLAKAADESAAVVYDGRTKTLDRARAAVKKYRLLRDWTALDLAQAGATVEYEIVGDDPANPGIVYTRRTGGEEGSPDVSAVFTTRSPEELWNYGQTLEDKFGNAGVVFQKLDLSGTGARAGAGPAGVLVLLVGTVVAVLSFFWLWKHAQAEGALSQWAISAISSDPTLSASEKSLRQSKVRQAGTMWDSMFRTKTPWTAILVAAAIAGLAFFVVPALVPGGARAS
jgi:hypothetical protein